MKKLLRKLLNGMGLDIIRYTAPAKPSVSVRTSNLKLYNTATGNYWLPEDAKSDGIRNAIIAGKIFDEPIVSCAENYIVPGQIVLDVGANFGQMSILFAKMAGRYGKVYSFEADDFIFDILKKNIIENNMKNIIPYFGAVHNETGKNLIFPIQDFARFETYGSYGIDYTNTKKGREVPTLTIDSLNIEGKISFMKIDVQGGDLFVLEGAVNTIKKNKMPILFEFEYLFQDELSLKFQEYVDFVNSIDYYFAKIINYQNYLILPKE